MSHFDISATGTSKDKGVALPLYFETPKCKMRKAPMSHFDISATGTSKNKGVALPLHFETPKREMRKTLSSHFDISVTGTSKDKGFLSSTAFRNPKTRNAKSAQEPFRHFGYRDFKGQRVALFHCISKPRNAKCENHPGAISTFQLLGLQRTKGCSLPLHFETPKRKMRKVPRSHFGYRDFKGQRVALFHCISKPRNVKCEKRPGAISTFRLPGLQRTKGLLFHCISKPRNAKCEKHSGAILTFRLPGLQRTKGCFLCF
jgi:hypothetical protein